MKYLGIDYGSKRIGISISDENGRLAFPHSVLKNSKESISDIKKIVTDEKIDEIVLGESVSSFGGENDIMEYIRPFKKQIEEEIKLPVFFEKEFFTSVEARRIQGGGAGVDASASALILQRYLDRKNQKNN